MMGIYIRMIICTGCMCTSVYVYTGHSIKTYARDKRQCIRYKAQCLGILYTRLIQDPELLSYRYQANGEVRDRCG